jgi:MutL protein
MTYDDYMAIESILALDCGSTQTRAILIDQVGVEYRLIACTEAPSTIEPPWNDVTASVRHAVSRLSAVTGWQLLDERGQIITPEHQGGGVDAVVVITSAGRPLRLVLSGIMRDVSLASARRALSTSYVVVEGTVSLDRTEGGTHRTNDDVEGQVQMLRKVEPDAVVIVGGVDGGTSRPVLQAVEAVALACAALPEGARPPVIYAGNTELRSRVAEIVGADAELRAIDNVLPGIGLENPGPLQTEIEEMYRQTKMERLPGFGTLASWSPVQVLPTAKALAHSLHYLARLDGINVLGVDVGGSTVTVAAVVDEQPDLTVRSDLGLSYNAVRLLDEEPVESILRWLPFEMTPTDVRNELHNKALRCRTVPQTRQDLLLEQAVAREVLRLTLVDIASRWPKGPSLIYPNLLPKFHLIVGGGGILTSAPNCGQAALILLDALQPVGVSGLALDKVGLLAPLGAVAMVNPLAAAQVMEKDTLLNLGTVVAPVGMGREGDIALTFKIVYEDGRSLEVEVPYGSLEVIPLPTGQTATLELRPTRRFDVGLGTRGQAGTTKVEGGLIGIMIDARGRPLPFADDPEAQQEKMQRWLWDMGS